MFLKKTCLSILTTYLVVIFALSEGYPVDKNPNDTDINNAIEYELLTDAAIASHRLDVMTVEGIVTLSGTVDNLLARERAVDIAQSIKGVRSVVDRISVLPIRRPDQELRKDVEQALLYDPATDAYEVDVEVQDGAVTLTGKVDSWYEKQLSTEVVKGVRGVKDIKNNIDFTLKSQRPGFEIKEEIRRRLASDVWIDEEFITVDVTDNKVTLTGAVGSAKERVNAYANAWVSGVNSVDISELRIEPWARDEIHKQSKHMQKSDSEIKKAVEDALLYDARVLSFKPEVNVDQGVVTLTGTVGNLKAKQAAEEDAKNTVGVWRVKNLLKVRPEVNLSDDAIADRIRNAIQRDPFLGRYDFTVSVYNSSAYLYGTVDSEFEKIHLEDIASGAKGVVDVVNYVRVDKPTVLKSDWEIDQDIEDALFWNPFIDSKSIEVAVEDRVVTLTGTVGSWNDYELAAEEAYDNGAWKVRNRLLVEYGPAELRPYRSEEK